MALANDSIAAWYAHDIAAKLEQTGAGTPPA